MTNSSASKSAGATDSPTVVSPDTPVVDAPAVVTDPADSSDAWKDDSADSTDTLLGDHKVDKPVVPISADDPVGYQTVGDQDAVVDNAALNAHAAEQASTTDQGFITRGGTVDASQGTPAGLDLATPDDVHSDGGPTVFTDDQIDRLEELNLESFEESIRDRLSQLKDDDTALEELRPGRHSNAADLSGDTAPQTDTSGDSPASA